MKLFLLIIFFLSVQITFAQKQKVRVAADGNCKEANWVMDFEDNFDGKLLDLKIWKKREDLQGTLENEATEQYYTLENVIVENGICKIIPKKETVIRKAVDWMNDTAILKDGKMNMRPYYHTSAWIETKQHFDYGKFEMRCKVPLGKGLWPAFWMYGEQDKKSNEIDVFEFWNTENTFGEFQPKKLSMVHQMTVHCNNTMSGEKYEGCNFSQDFHTFSVIWDSTKIEWRVDGILKRQVSKYLTRFRRNVDCKDIKAHRTYLVNPSFPKLPMTIIANLAIQSGKNSPDENSFNSAFEIDYVRYYKAEK